MLLVLPIASTAVAAPIRLARLLIHRLLVNYVRRTPDLTRQAVFPLRASAIVAMLGRMAILVHHVLWVRSRHRLAQMRVPLALQALIKTLLVLAPANPAHFNLRLQAC